MTNLHLNKIILTSLFVLSSTVYADELFFEPIAYNDNSTTTFSNLSSDLKSESLNTVIVTGYGVNYEKALKNAFQTAIEQQIGILVDSETLIKNDKIIKDDILTASNGFIKDYTQLSQTSKDGLVQVKIKAIVKSQEVERKIQSLNISSFKIKNSSNIYAEIITKDRSKKDASSMLKKSLVKLLSRENYSNLLKFKIIDYNILKNKVKNGKVPVEISYKIEFNNLLYKEKMDALENILKNIGSNVSNKTDYPRLKPGSGIVFTASGRVRMKKNSIVIIRKNGRSYVSNTWILPKNISLRQIKNYLKEHVSIEDNIRGSINMEILDKKKNILGVNIINASFERFHPMYNASGYSYFLSGYIANYDHYIFSPFVSTGRHGHGVTSSELIKKSTIKINIEDLRKISSATIQYQ